MTLLETPRCLLRRFEDSDFEDVHAYAREPEVTRYQSWGPNSESDTRDFLERSRESFDPLKGSHLQLAIVERDADRVIGGCGLQAGRKDFREFECGWTLHQDYWRRGFGTEAVSAMLAFAYRELHAHRIYALIDVDNQASIALAEKLGFVREGRFARDTLIRGEWRDTYVYARLEPESRTGT